MKILNINALVGAKLTPFGMEVLKEEHEALRLKRPSIGEFTPPKMDKDGYCQMPLWELMNIFGQYRYMGSKNSPFEANIRIDDAEFAED